MREKFYRGIYLVYKRLLSPMLHTFGVSGCRYLPTCSEYAYTAVHRFGVLRGSWLALKRLGRCRPGCEGGFDPVPDRDSAPVAHLP